MEGNFKCDINTSSVHVVHVMYEYIHSFDWKSAVEYDGGV